MINRFLNTASKEQIKFNPSETTRLQNQNFQKTVALSLKSTREQLALWLDPWLDRLFMLQPSLLIPTWILMAAGLGAGAGSITPDLFWRISWDLTTGLLFMGGTLIAGSALVFVGAAPRRPAEIQVLPALSEPRRPTGPAARRAGLALLTAGLFLVTPVGILALAAGLLLFALWGLLYTYLPPLGWAGPFVTTLIHGAAAGCLFLLGWSASGAAAGAGATLMLPYALVFTAIAALTGIYPVAGNASNRLSQVVIIRVVVAISTLLTLAAGLLGFYSGDPMISTSAAIIIPFQLVALVYLRPVDIFRTVRYALLIMTVFVGARYPLLYLPVLAAFYLSRYYYQRRYGHPYPTMEGNLWNMGRGLEFSSDLRED